MPVDALDSALGVDTGDAEARDASLARIVQASTALCPDVTLSLCQLESLRRRGLAGDAALCSSNCTQADFVAIEAETCSAVDDYPQDLFADRSYAGKSYTDRACCKAGVDAPSDQCPPGQASGGGGGGGGSSSNTGAVIASVLAALMLVLGIAVLAVFLSRRCVQRRIAGFYVFVRSLLSLMTCSLSPHFTAGSLEPKRRRKIRVQTQNLLNGRVGPLAGKDFPPHRTRVAPTPRRRCMQQVSPVRTPLALRLWQLLLPWKWEGRKT